MTRPWAWNGLRAYQYWCTSDIHLRESCVAQTRQNSQRLHTIGRCTNTCVQQDSCREWLSDRSSGELHSWLQLIRVALEQFVQHPTRHRVPASACRVRCYATPCYAAKTSF
jgi:hypothetical protein